MQSTAQLPVTGLDGIRYVSSQQRHAGEDHAILAARHALYTTAKDSVVDWVIQATTSLTRAGGQ